LFPDAEKHLYDFYTVLATLENVMQKLKGMELTVEGEDAAKAAEYAQKVEDDFNTCMSDDFNTALALSNLFGYFKEIKKQLAEANTKGLIIALAMSVQIRKTYALLGLFVKNPNEYKAWYEAKNTSAIPEEVKAVAEERWAARLNRDWAKSDELRNKLAELGYAVKDSKTGYELTKM
jgi:cysteinyl-tRNA synthetase